MPGVATVDDRASYQQLHKMIPVIENGRTMAEIMSESSLRAAEQGLRYRPDIKQTVEKIYLAREQGVDRDDEEGAPVAFITAERAERLVMDTAKLAYIRGQQWHKPAVSATPEGGMHLSWRIDGRWATVTIFPPGQDMVCVTEDAGGAFKREAISDWEAVVDRVLKVFESVVVDLPDAAPRDAFTHAVLRSLEEESIEDGYLHSAEGFLEKSLTTYKSDAPQWIQRMFHDQLERRPSVAAALLICLGRLNPAMVQPWAGELARSALAHSRAEVRDAAVHTFEIWEDESALPLLRAHVEREPVPWVASYARQVIAELSR